MDKLIIQGIRCFRKQQEAPLKPLTLLVGENNSGKTTFLAACRLAWDTAQAVIKPDFNEDPFPLGSFDHIASKTSGRTATRDHFVVGFEQIQRSRGKTELPKLTHPIRVTGKFLRVGSQPQLAELVIQCAPYKISIDFPAGEGQWRIVLGTPAAEVPVSPSLRFTAPPASYFAFFEILPFLIEDASRRRGSVTKLKAEDRKFIEEIFLSLRHYSIPRPYAFAPIRSKPRRTYDLSRDIPEPEGSHIPMVLAGMFTGQTEARENLVTQLELFGKACGLFEHVDVKYLGKKKSGDPFQIRLQVSGPKVNLVDVGYGVSQVLPLLVDAIQRPPGGIFLIQQPEVHLHPRAQAQLGSFLGALVKHDEKRFIVETHSDYLIDRVRMDVRDKLGLNADDVAILYFERRGSEVAIHNLRIDDQGNVVGAPRGYRDFFLEEERRYFGVDACVS
jgi:hypothetical protein